MQSYLVNLTRLGRLGSSKRTLHSFQRITSTIYTSNANLHTTSSANSEKQKDHSLHNVNNKAMLHTGNVHQKRKSDVSQGNGPRKTGLVSHDMPISSGDSNTNKEQHLQVQSRKKSRKGQFSPGGSPGVQITSKDPLSVFKPVVVKPNPDDLNFGEEIAGKINREALLKELNRFYQHKEIRILAKEHGLDDFLYNQAYTSFRRFCMDVEHLPTELYILFSDILQGARHNHDIFGYFLSHARKVFPHLDCIDDLKKISDLTDPSNWYPEARAMNRRIIFHAGPTNSGKTYHALERFMSAKSGVYCGPLKLLAVEVFNKTNKRETNCDLVTGEERRMGREDGEPSPHVACTVEMTNLSQPYEVAVIDEIQVVKDFQRGWAWSRALLGVQAEEIHVCGEAAALDLVKEMMMSTGEEVEVRNYRRLTPLLVQDKALETLAAVEPGDCIVCFNKNDIYAVSRGLEKMGKEVAVIYGSLPPNTKLAMAAKFNDPQDSCKVLVATDAVGMGLNLNIRRMIFYGVTKIQLSENGEKEVDLLTVSQALQIAGRAGRYGTQWDTGYVTTFKQEDLKPLQDLLKQEPDEILHAGLHPTFDQIEMYAYHLPNATMANLIDIFISLSTLDDSMYTLCQMSELKFLADTIEHIKMPLKAKYTFCCAPINQRMPFVCAMFLKMARQFSKGEVLSFDWLCTQVGWPFSPAETILDLVHLEAVHDVFDLYLWLSYRFSDMFPDVEIVREVQNELDTVIEDGVSNIVQLLKNSEKGHSSGIKDAINDSVMEMKRKQQDRMKNKWTHPLETMEGFDKGNKKTKKDTFEEGGTEVVQKSERRKPKSGEVANMKLTDRLLAQGLITPQMLEDIKKELKQVDDE